MIERVVGGGKHSITLSNPSVRDVILHYETLEGITQDIDDARVLGGIHFSFDEAAAEQGRRVGAYVHEHALRPSAETSPLGEHRR